MNKYLWCSPHTPTEEQMKSLDGLLHLLENQSPELQDRLSNMSYNDDLSDLAWDLISVAQKGNYILVQPGGSPAFQCMLGRSIAISNEVDGENEAPEVIYSFSKRVSKDIPQEDGTIKKISLFHHEGWVNV